MKSCLNRGDRASFYFWRDSNGNEVDIIAETETKLLPIEIKGSKTLNRIFSGLNCWTALAGNQAISLTLVYGGKDSLTHQGIRVFGWQDMESCLA